MSHLTKTQALTFNSQAFFSEKIKQPRRRQNETYLSGGSETALELQVVNTLVDWLSICGTLGDRALTSTTTNTNPVNNVTLLSLVSQAAGFVWSGGAGGTVDGSQMAVLPCAYTQKKAKQIRLLLLEKFLKIFVRTHADTGEEQPNKRHQAQNPQP